MSYGVMDKEKMKLDCQYITNHLIDIVENIIPESQEKVIQEHITDCPVCDSLVKGFTHAWEQISPKEILVPSERFWPELVARIQALEKPVPFREKIALGLKQSLRPVAVSLIVLIAGFFGYKLGDMPDMEAAQVQMSYFENYVQDFQDFPEGSVSDFYMRYVNQEQKEVP